MTMAGVAEQGGVAKATIYNHFRSRAELLDGLLVDELTLLDAVAAAAGENLVDQLTAVARDICANPMLAGLRLHEPEVLLRMTEAATQPGHNARADAVAQAVAERLAATSTESDGAAVDVVIRWWCSLAWSPLTDDQVTREATLIARAVT